LNSSVREVRVPDLGTFKDVPVIEVLVKPGDAIRQDSTLIVLESDKSTLDVPAPADGVIRELSVKVGDTVSHGSLLLLLETMEAVSHSTLQSANANTNITSLPLPATASLPETGEVHQDPSRFTSPSEGRPPPHGPHGTRDAMPPFIAASPHVRKLARTLGATLERVAPTGRNRRVLRADVETFIRAELAAKASGLTDPTQPPHSTTIDFSVFGPVERQAQSRIRRIAGANLARNWAQIPHVTNFDEADVTDLEDFRTQINREKRPDDPKLTLLAFLLKASAVTLQEYPQFNSSLQGQELVLKRYFHVGFAADTPDGLLVPVIRNVDRKGLRDIAREAVELASAARANKLKGEQMQGGCFSVSSLGGIGGTGFTPIINAPEVAILGAARAEHRPKWDATQFRPRLVLPLCLSWDHRVVDGAAAARFLAYLSSLLTDFRRVCL
jgi:pyruvate dehydrogenase E2 component (dihydrolipoamide acetyltransferase)